MNMTSLSVPGNNLSVYRLSISSVSHDVQRSENRSQNERRVIIRRQTGARIGLVTSTVATLSGFISVLVTIYYCIVPELRADNITYTQCRLLSDDVKVNGRRAPAGELIQNQAAHHLLPVMYRVEHGAPQRGWLNVRCDRSTNRNYDTFKNVSLRGSALV